jgi:hypothetical protein
MLGAHASSAARNPVPKTSQSPQSSKPPPPPSSGGNLKYVVLGLLFLGGALGLWFLIQKDDAPPAPPPAPEVKRVNPMEQPDLDLEPEPEQPEPEPEPEPEEPVAKPAKVRTGGEWECSGDLPNPGKIINDHRAQIRSCYERRLKVNNVLQGDLTLRLKVGATGKVVATSVSGSIRDQEVFSCVRALAQTWTFPVPTGGACAVVQVPFQFSPKNP